ncbi:MAG: FAD-dependent oxidoreductase [Rhodospirillales bacterium]|nr:FAD-dependent oxidoreductase [Rhodospirillales bacterium]MDE2574946.1 FAD-dependent oxidoreductase [Rhodospirillales bacterium]
MHVVVIGAGIVGAATALELQRDGHRVTIIEPGPPGGEQSASYGNGCWLSPSSVLPVSAPGLWRKVPGWLADPLGPLAVRWSYLPRALPWLWRLLRAASNETRLRRIAAALRPLVADAPAHHRRLAEEAGVGHLIHQSGLLYIFPTRADFEAEALAWKIRAECGVTWIELDADELRQREPALDRRYTLGLLMEAGGHCSDPGAYVAALVAHAQAQGAALVATRAQGFDMAGGRLRAVRTAGGDIACERAVIAAGAWSKTLAEAAGDRVPLETERGYHAMIAAPEGHTRVPVMPSDGKMANTMTAHGLRIAGQVEIAALDAAPNWKRAEILRDYALRTYPALPRDLPAERVKVWMGHRPSTPDGLPCIGPASGCADVVHCFGHGHVGLAAGALSGRLAADAVSGKTPAIDLTPYAAARFR